MFRPPLSLAAAAVAALAAGITVSGAAAAEPQAVATYKDWSVFVRDVDGEKRSVLRRLRQRTSRQNRSTTAISSFLSLAGNRARRQTNLA